MPLSIQELESLLNKHRSEISALNALVQLLGENGNVAELTELFTVVIAKQRTPNLLRTSGGGTIAPLVYSFSVYNAGAANGVLLGATIKPGETFNFSAEDLGSFYGANTITYDGTGTELVIIYNT